MMRRLNSSVATLVAMLIVAAVPLLGQSSALAGTWKINLAKSTYSPGPAPKSQTLTWERVAGGFNFTVDSVNTQGQVTHTENMEKDDGS